MTTISPNKNIFASNEYALLLWLSEHQTDMRSKSVVKFSQSDIAGELQCSPTTVNKWMKSLCDSGCLEQQKKGNYRVTNTGQKVIAKMTEIDKLVGGKKNGK